MARTTRPAPLSRSRRIALPALLVAVVLLGQSAAFVTADHGGRAIESLLSCDRPVTPPRCASVAGNRVHLVHFDDGLDPGLVASLRDTMAEDYTALTDLTVLEQSRVTAATDVIAISGDFGENGAAGWTYCPPDAPQGTNHHGHRWCRNQELYFNVNARYSAFFADDASRDHIACHELGHTVGLLHWGNPPTTAGPAAATCMTGNTPDGAATLHQIDVDHINAYYRPERVERQVDPGVKLVHAPDEPGSPATAWSGGAVAASEVEHFASLTEMTAAADAVVLARVAGVAPGRTFGIPGRRALGYAAITLALDELIAGRPGLDRDPVTIEVPLFGGPSALADMRADLPGASGLFFLRRKTDVPPGADLYRLVTFRAVVLDEGGRAAAIPGDGHDFLAALDGLAFADVLARARMAAAP